MFETMDSSENRTSGGSPKAGTWASMNAIQKAGLLGSAPFIFCSWIYDGKIGEVLTIVGWTTIVMGYVAGNFWRYRHALHFWWSTVAAGAIHVFTLPIYLRFSRGMKFAHGSSGKSYLNLTFLLMIIEVLALQILLKRLAMLIYRRTRIHIHDYPDVGAR